MQHTFKLRTAILTFAVFAMALIPSLACALGLGEIHSDTRIGQPFSAKIPILHAGPGELHGLSVSLANHAAYQNANLNEPDYLFSLKFSVAKGPNGPYVQVTSNKAVKLPFLNLLIRASWPSGQVTRQYTVLLNPPTFVSGSGAQQPVSPPASTTVSAKPVPAQQVAQQPVSRPKSPPVQATPAASSAPAGQLAQQTQQQPQPVTSMPGSYTVRRGDTLWGIARQLHVGTGASVNQTMIAIYRANPRAFHGNINRLAAGHTLKVPTQSEIVQIGAREATRLVARQNREWRSTGTSPQVVANNGMPEQPVPGTSRQAASKNPPSQAVAAPASGSVSSQSAVKQAAMPETSGHVVLTTPEVTATKSAAAVPGSAVAGTSSGAVGAAGATQKSHVSANPGTKAGMAGTGASVGGPMKVHNNAMAGMAATRQSATTGKAAVAKSKVNNTNAVNSVNSVNTGSQEQGGGLMYWLRRPSGWIVIAAIILILIAIALFVLRRRYKAAEQQAPLATISGRHEAEEQETESGVDIDDIEAKENPDDIGIATYLGGSSLDVNKVDAMDEADLHIGFGDYDKAAQILREGIERQPQRHELRRRLLDVLFAAGEGEAFAAEARNYSKEAAGSADWQEIVAMGRQVCPQDEFFADQDQGHAGTPDSTEEHGGDRASDDFAALDLDRLKRDDDEGEEQDEFERTMDELSTFIETYVPASAETPVALQLPPDEKSTETQANTETDDESTPKDEPLDFHLDDEDLPPPGSDSTVESEISEEEETDEPENMVDTKLDLARAYIDMGDADSARSVLEEVIDEGDETQGGEARRLLENLD